MGLLDLIKSVLGFSSYKEIQESNDKENKSQLSPEEVHKSPMDSTNLIKTNSMKTSELMLKFLKEQGFMPEKLDNGWISFKYQMRTFLYLENDEDAEFFQLAMPGICEVTEDNRAAALEAANKISCNFKAVKAIVTDDNVWLMCENFLDSTPVLEDMVPRMLNGLMHAYSEFGE